MQFANFDLTDSSAATATFTAMTNEGLLCTWKDKSAAVPSLRPVVTCGMRKAKGSTPRKVTVKVILPYTHTLDSVEYRGETSAFIDFIVPETADATDVADLLAFVGGAIGQAQISSAVSDGEFPA